MNATPNNKHDGSTRRYQELLQRSSAFRNLASDERRDLSQALAKIEGFLHDLPSSPVARQLGPDLSALRPGNPGGSMPPASSPMQPGPIASPPGAAPPAPSGSGGAVGRAGEVARATLSAIDFPSFVGSLIQGTFQAIVDSSIQQMQAYADMLKNVAGTVDRFMQDNVTDGAARDYLAEQHGEVFSRDTSSGRPELRVNGRNPSGELPNFLKDMGFGTAGDLDQDAVENVVVPSTRRYLAESRQRTLATMVMMGINRVVVDDGEISAKLQFHIDATEAMQMRFDQTKTTAGNMSGTAGRSPFGAQAVMVNTASLNAQTNLNVRADLTGQVRVKFRSDAFPLERFADSAAIQLINSNARVPQPLPAPTPGATGNAPAGTASPTPPTQALTPTIPPITTPPDPATPPAAPQTAAWMPDDQWAPGE